MICVVADDDNASLTSFSAVRPCVADGKPAHTITASYMTSSPHHCGSVHCKPNYLQTVLQVSLDH